MTRQSKRVKLSNGKRLMIASRQGWRCNECSDLLAARFDIDHTDALCLGGPDVLSNLVALCSNCHANKTTIEIQRYWDIQKEKRTGKSRFFDKTSVDYIVPIQQRPQ